MAPVRGQKITARTALHSPQERQLQGTAMVVRRALGDSIREIATAFGLSRNTVFERLREARENGALPLAQTYILEHLVPLALATFHNTMLDETLDPETRLKAATEILKGSSSLQQKSLSTVVHEAGDSLEKYHQERRMKGAIEGEIEVLSDESKRLQ